MEIRKETKHLLSTVGLGDLRDEILRIADEMVGVEFIYQRESAYDALVKIDCGIPGLGLHNVNEQTEDGWWIGVYRIEDRPIFRGIQYVGQHLGNIKLEWLARTIVTESCYHVEGSANDGWKWRATFRSAGYLAAQTPDPWETTSWPRCST